MLFKIQAAENPTMFGGAYLFRPKKEVLPQWVYCFFEEINFDFILEAKFSGTNLYCKQNNRIVTKFKSDFFLSCNATSLSHSHFYPPHGAGELRGAPGSSKSRDVCKQPST